MKKIIYIFIGCLLLTSCSGMLDIESHSAVSPGSVTPQDLSALRMGMYNKVRTLRRENLTSLLIYWVVT